MNRRFLLLITAVVVVIIAYTLFSSVKDPAAVAAEYRQTVLEKRRDKDAFFKDSKDSPIPKRADFKALVYYEPDPAYRVTATVERLSEGVSYKVQMTRGETETYQPYGRATFTLNGEECRLLVFRSQDDGQLFVPFNDATNGTETYGGGRYLDVPETDVKNDRILLDFNAAYNPFCVYNPTYTCPIPPAENHLRVAVRAGEKGFEAH